MLRTIGLFAAVAVVFSSQVLEALASGATRAQTGAQTTSVYHRNYQKGFNAGYQAGYASGNRQAAKKINSKQPIAPVEMFGVTVYGANPCYQYNDRDWDFEKIC